MLNVFSKARAKVIKNAKLKTLRVIIAFNVYETNSKGEFKFPVQKKCDWVSGDLNTELDVLNALAYAKDLLRTDNIELV
jgi:predicted transport protein